MVKQYTRIAFDIDNTMTYLQPTLDLMADHFGMLPVVEDDILSFRLSEAYEVTREEEMNFWEIREKEMCEESVFALTRVQNILEHFAAPNCEFLYITARDERYTDETISWLVSTGMPSGRLVLLGKKSKMGELLEWGAEAVFEDNPSFFEEWVEYNLEGEFDAYCIDYPYNQNVPATARLERGTGRFVGEKEAVPEKYLQVPASFLAELD